MTRFLLAALAVATIALTAAPVAAKQRTLRYVNAPSTIDVAAIPAYPTADAVRAGRQPSRAASRRVAASAPRHPGLEARMASPEARQGESTGSGVVRSAKTGATARVAPRHRAKFQAYIDDLESRGAAVYYMGGLRRGRCSLASQHPCGGALDVCQDRRDRVSGRKNCHLPQRADLISIAARHGLFEGGQWCNGDMGHAQVIPTASTCSRNLYADVASFHARSRP